MVERSPETLSQGVTYVTVRKHNIPRQSSRNRLVLPRSALSKCLGRHLWVQGGLEGDLAGTELGRSFPPFQS